VRRTLAVVGLLAALAAPAVAKKATPPAPLPVAPVAKRIDLASTVHGDERHDFYAWLENREDPEVAAYLQAENAYADAMTAAQAPLVARLEAEMRARVVEDDVDPPVRRGAYDYYVVHKAGLAYPIYMRRGVDADDAVERVTLDLNELARGKSYLELGVYEVSDDGRWLAYSLDETGDENYTLHVKDLESGWMRRESIPRVTGAVWSADGRFLVYTVRDDAYRSYACYWHEVGEHSQDRLMYEEKDARFDLSIARTRSREWLVLHSASYESSEVRVTRAERPGGPWTVVAERRPGHIYELDHDEDTFYIRTNLKAPGFRVVATPEIDPGIAYWKDVVAPRADVQITALDAFAGHLALVEREGGRPVVTLVDVASGKRVRPRLPGGAWSVGVAENGERGAKGFRFGLGGFEQPTRTVEADFATGKLTVLKAPAIGGGYQAAAYTSEAFEVRTSDGAKIPVSLVHRKKGHAKRTPAPLLLLVYGAYGEPFDPEWDESLASLVDRGVVVAIAHVRGGGERGEPWHDAGKRANRAVAVGDVIAVADELVKSKRTSRALLGVSGVSAGGLLVGAVLNARPDLAAVALLRVPFLTAVDTMLDEDAPLTTTEYEEWGDPRDAAQYAYIKAYDPYGNLGARGGSYPAVWVDASWADGRVGYFEAAKWVAKLRTVTTSGRPVLLETELQAGHAGTSGRYGWLSQRARAYAFFLTAVGRAG
jgi:oligopeptidase B